MDTIENDEYLKSELPAIKQLQTMGYEYKRQRELNKERRDYREVLLYDRLETAIRKHNPELDEDGVYETLSEINESKFPYTLDSMDANERIRAKLVGLSRSGGLEPITVTQNFGEGNVEKTVRLFDFDNPEKNDFLVTNQFQLDGLKQLINISSNSDSYGPSSKLYCNICSCSLSFMPSEDLDSKPKLSIFLSFFQPDRQIDFNIHTIFYLFANDN